MDISKEIEHLRQATRRTSFWILIASVFWFLATLFFLIGFFIDLFLA